MPTSTNAILFTLAGCLALASTAFSSGNSSSYCSATLNSSGNPAHIRWIGPYEPHTGSLLVYGCPAQTSGMFLYGLGAQQVPFGDGFSCIAGTNWILARKRTDASGAVLLDLGQQGEPEDLRWLNYNIGATWYFQYAYRDLAGPLGNGFNLSDGVAVNFGP